MDTVMPELLTGFLVEAQGYVTRLRELLIRSQDVPDPDRLREEHAQASILSGAAEMLGLEAVAALTLPIIERVNLRLAAGEALSDVDCQELAAILAQFDTHLSTPVDSDSDAPSKTGVAT